MKKKTYYQNFKKYVLDLKKKNPSLVWFNVACLYKERFNQVGELFDEMGFDWTKSRFTWDSNIECIAVYLDDLIKGIRTVSVGQLGDSDDKEEVNISINELRVIMRKSYVKIKIINSKGETDKEIII